MSTSIFKLIFLLLFCINISADEKHDIEIAIISGNVVALNNLLRKTISIVDKNKYIALSKNMTLKYAEPMNSGNYKKSVHFAVGGFSILMFIQQTIEIGNKIGMLDDLRKQSVVFGVCKAAILFGFGIKKLHDTYNFYHKNKKYTAAIQIEEAVNSIQTDADIVRKKE